MKKRKGRCGACATLVVAAVFVLLTSEAISQTVTVISGMPIVTREHHVVIDAGHGGEDGGTTSCNGISESKINLEIALRLEDLLHLLGYNTVMIRTTDTSVYTSGTTIAQKKVSDLKERVRIVNSTQNSVLVSIHQNYFSDGRYNGAQVFYAPNEESEILAKTMQRTFVQTLNIGSKRECKAATGIYLMNRIQCPGILVECGFLSNQEEEAKLLTEEYQKKIACVIAHTLSVYLSNT